MGIWPQSGWTPSTAWPRSTALRPPAPTARTPLNRFQPTVPTSGSWRPGQDRV